MGRGGSRVALIIAALLVVALQHLIPAGRYVLYPFTLLTTWVHEMGHGLTALALGGHFERLEIYADASGVAYTAVREGAPAALVALGGLLAPPLLCTAILVGARGPSRAYAILMALAFALGASLLLWVRSLVGMLTVPGLALFIAIGAHLGGGRIRLLLAQLLAVVLALDTLTRTLRYLFMDRVEGGALPGARSDVSNVALSLGGPYWLWGALVAVVALGLLGLGLRSAFRGGAREDEGEISPG